MELEQLARSDFPLRGLVPCPRRELRAAGKSQLQVVGGRREDLRQVRCCQHVMLHLSARPPSTVTRRTHTVPLADPYAAFLSVPLFAFSRAFAASAQLGSTRSHRIPTSSRYLVRVIATVTRSMPRGSGRGSVDATESLCTRSILRAFLGRRREQL